VSTVCLIFYAGIIANGQYSNETTIEQGKDNPIKKMKQEPMHVRSVTPENPEDISPLLIGEEIPRVKIPRADGVYFDLNEAVASKPTILVFYRGGWCPFCSRQLAGLQEIYRDLKEIGYQLIAIGTDDLQYMDQSVTNESLDYTLLSDADLAVSRSFGLAYKAPDSYSQLLPETSGGKNLDLLLPVPSVFILDRNEVIQFEYINPDFRQRIDPGLLGAATKVLYPKL
jgi:peroxiredoxin